MKKQKKGLVNKILWGTLLVSYLATTGMIIARGMMRRHKKAESKQHSFKSQTNPQLIDYDKDGIKDLLYVKYLQAIDNPITGERGSSGIEISVAKGNEDGTFSEPEVVDRVEPKYAEGVYVPPKFK